MKTRFIITGLLAAALLISSGVSVPAQTPEEMDPEMAAMMAKFEELGKPGPMHEMLGKLVGKWEVTMSFWMAPDAPSEETKGTSEFKAIFGGRYIVQDYVGSFMGQTLHGMGMVAYDNFREEFIGLWLDEMSTGIFFERGKWDDSAKVTNYRFTMDDPMTDRKDVPGRAVDRFVDDDTYEMEMYHTNPEGKEFLSMRGVYKRQK